MIGLGLCVAGLISSPQVAFQLAENPPLGILFGLIAFGAWGMGFNLATVSYLSLASEISGERGRSRTIAVMFFMMIASIIITAISLSQMVDPYTPQAIVFSFWVIGLAALVIGLVGVIGLEKPFAEPVQHGENYPWAVLLRFILGNRQAKHFFIYLVILLVALLGQDILLEPFGAQAFGLTVQQTTRITSIWGTCVLAALLAAGAMEGRISKRKIATIGGWGAFAGFGLITASGYLQNGSVFYTGVVLLGLGTGLSTVSNLSLMLDMTTAEHVGLFIGAWGMANAFSRLIGSLMAGAVRDVITRLSGDLLLGYVIVFALMAIIMLLSLFMLRKVDVQAFRNEAGETASLVERAALAGEPG